MSGVGPSHFTLSILMQMWREPWLSTWPEGSYGEGGGVRRVSPSMTSHLHKLFIDRLQGHFISGLAKCAADSVCSAYLHGNDDIWGWHTAPAVESLSRCQSKKKEQEIRGFSICQMSRYIIVQIGFGSLAITFPGCCRKANSFQGEQRFFFFLLPGIMCIGVYVCNELSAAYWNSCSTTITICSASLSAPQRLATCLEKPIGAGEWRTLESKKRS